METIGLLHPGEMGAAIGAALRARGHEVLWAARGRSEQTRMRALQAGLRDADTVEEVASNSSIVLSVCPPHAALELAKDIADAAYAGVFIDANAVSPSTASAIGELVAARGASFVDGGVVGPPPSGARRTRLYLSGTAAASVAHLFDGTPVDVIVLDGPVGAASALKMTYAAWTKGTAALLLAIRAAARAHGVEEALLEAWQASIPELPAQSLNAARSASTKGWRWVGEMEEIAETLAAAGLPAGFYEAAAEVFRRSPRLDATTGEADVLDPVLAGLLAPPAPRLN